MYARSGYIKVFSYKRSHWRNVIPHFISEVCTDFSHNRRIHSVKRTAKGCVFKHHRFKRNITCSLSDTKQRAVYRTAAIKPCSGRIGNRFIKIVMSVPFKHFARYSGIMLQAIHDTRNTSWQRCTCIRHTVSHGVTCPYLNRNAYFF